MNKALVIPIIGIILILIDLYVFQAFRVIARDKSFLWQKIIYFGYWMITIIALTAFFSYNLLPPDTFPEQMRYFMIVGVTILYFTKLFADIIQVTEC